MNKYSDIPTPKDWDLKTIEFAQKAREKLEPWTYDFKKRRANFVELCEELKIVVCADEKLVEEVNPQASMLMWATDKKAGSGLRGVAIPKNGFDYTFAEFINVCYKLLVDKEG